MYYGDLQLIGLKQMKQSQKEQTLKYKNNRNQKLQSRLDCLFESLENVASTSSLYNILTMVYLQFQFNFIKIYYTTTEYLIPSNILVFGIDLSGISKILDYLKENLLSLRYYEVICLYDDLRENQNFMTSIELSGQSIGSVTAILEAYNIIQS
ncbi:unnamed protein product [Paramecium sonneborni]|uniref:Uncharacterized protein n=1 Tax=Paramecium sonneborni TaxID=65129 RepID=A0A8S1MFD7_9CILI|nr:unnamed protein product [Paramecium sonneborni]